MKKAITGLTAIYIFAIGIVFSVLVGLNGSTIVNVAIAEAVFSYPMVLSYILALIMKRVEACRVLLTFEVGYSMISLLMLLNAYAGDRDFKDQFALMFVPLIGFPGTIITGLLAGYATRKKTS